MQSAQQAADQIRPEEVPEGVEPPPPGKRAKRIADNRAKPSPETTEKALAEDRSDAD